MKDRWLGWSVDGIAGLNKSGGFFETSSIAQHHPINLTQICPKASTLGLLDPSQCHTSQFHPVARHNSALPCTKREMGEPAKKADYVANTLISTVRRYRQRA